MSGQGKLSLAKQAVLEAIDRLADADRFAVVAYDDVVDVVAPAAEATPAGRSSAAERLRGVDPRNSTDLHAGWLSGCEQVAIGQRPDGVNRVLLLTDGLANRGVTDSSELGRLAFDLRRRGITTSTFGVGTDFDESLLQAMADGGGGHFYYIGDVAQMRDHITSEVGEALDVVARDVALEVTVPESVRVESLSPFRVEERGGRIRVLVGDMVAGQALSVVLRFRFDYGEVGREIGALVRVTDRDGAFEAAEPAPRTPALAWTYADHAANDVQPRDREVDRAVARTFAERARQEAVKLNREGRLAEAASALTAVRRRIEAYAGSDAELRAVAAGLREEAPVYAAAMPEMDRKARHYESSLLARSRSVDGKSIRRS
jgi:Ca-activated chloride channel family protein